MTTSLTPAIILVDLVASPHLVDESDGVLVFDRILPALKRGQKVCLSFEGAETVTTSFLNRAIGDLYQKLSASEVNDRLEVTEIDSEDLRRLERVKTFANEFYLDPEGVTAVREQALAEF